MLYNPPTGATDPSAPYVGKNAAAGTQGSRVPPKAVEAPQRELVALIAEAGLNPTNDDLKQALRAIRSGKLWTMQDVGSLNAISIQPPTAHTSLFLGLPFRVIPAYTNTGPVTLVLGTYAAVPLLRRDGSPLVIGDFVQNVPIDIWNDGLGNFRLMDVAFGEVQRIVANPILYVRTDGSDLNDGSANTATKAFATISAAIARGTSRFALSGSGTLTVQLGNPGAYAAPGPIAALSGSLLIQGDQTQIGSYVISGPGPANGSALIGSNGAQVRVNGLTVVNTGTTNHTIGAGIGGSVSVTNCALQCTTAGSGFSHFFAGSGGSISIGAGNTVSGSMASCIAAAAGNVILQTGTLTILGAPNFTYAFAYATNVGTITSAGGVTISGSATGLRYSVTLNGVMNTVGAGANFFPGSSAGTASSGGQYA